MHYVYYLVVGLHILACLFLIGVVLLQQGKGQDLASAFGGGGTQTAFGPRGSANVLSRATTILAGLFMITSLTLTVLRPKEGSILQQLPAGAPSPSPIAPAQLPVPLVSPAVSPGVTSTPDPNVPVVTAPGAPATAAPAVSTPAAPVATTPAAPVTTAPAPATTVPAATTPSAPASPAGR